jgi:lysyl-tRNA synthetase class II
MQLSDLEKIRVEKIERMRAAGVEPYPTRSEVTHSAAEAVALFEAAEKAGSTDPVSVTVGGRMRSQRLMGKIFLSTSKTAPASCSSSCASTSSARRLWKPFAPITTWAISSRPAA